MTYSTNSLYIIPNTMCCLSTFPSIYTTYPFLKICIYGVLNLLDYEKVAFFILCLSGFILPLSPSQESTPRPWHIQVNFRLFFFFSVKDQCHKRVTIILKKHTLNAIFTVHNDIQTLFACANTSKNIHSLNMFASTNMNS